MARAGRGVKVDTVSVIPVTTRHSVDGKGPKI
jgi:hypothetical protein